MSADLALPAGSPVPGLAAAVSEAGGRLLVVGGWVRDALLGVAPGDVDIEVHGIAPDALERLLRRFGSVRRVGQAFGVFLVQPFGFEVSVPRRDPSGPEGGQLSQAAPELSFEEASRRRDLTINSMGWDPLQRVLLDPHGGRRDIEARRLRATDERYFGSDPLRGLRVAQLAARFEMDPDDELVALGRRLDLSGVAAERFLGEFRKLLRARRPSLGLRFLERATLLRFFPELEAMIGVAQDPAWHPEGDVWVHTCMVTDRAAALQIGDPPDDEALGFAALCHDLGKPATTFTDAADGRVQSPAHDVEGVAATERFLDRLAAPQALRRKVGGLVRHHLAPALLTAQGAQPRAYRRLARRLEACGATMELLERVARADHLGRTTADARAGRFPAGDQFLAEARQLALELSAPRDLVRGRDVVARGVAPGPEVGRVLARCRAIQDDTGWQSAERILDAALERAG